LCINYTGITFSAFSSTAGLMRLMHFVGTDFVDVTTSLNTTAAVICGLVNSFSPFAIFEPAILQFASFQAKVEIEDERHKREFKAEGKGAQVGTAKPVTVRLAIGDDAGSTLAKVNADDDD